MAYLNMLESKMVDGLIVISGADEFGFKYTNAENGIPYVCIDRQPKDKKIQFSFHQITTKELLKLRKH